MRCDAGATTAALATTARKPIELHFHLIYSRCASVCGHYHRGWLL